MTMESKFDHRKVESEIYNKWEESGAFSPAPGKKPYTILMPPPNANASLHAGHGMYTIDDILIRWKRMQGYGAQWIPGRDHAGFETQFVYEKKLAKEGKSRLDFDRETLYKSVAEFVEDNSGLIFEQFRRLGFSADWTKSVFTLDPHVLETVFQTFRKMEADKLVYRSDYLVNYCTYCGTSLAELEIVHNEREDKLYYIKYGPLTVATVRPETMFGDTAVAVHPKDKRYSKYVGIEVPLPLTSRMIPVIADEMVDMKFGTGVLKITPAHDPNDFEAGKRHNLKVIRVIDQLGRMTLPEDVKIEGVQGLKVKAAREKTVEELEKIGAMEKIDEHYNHAVTGCYKCGRDMEPMTVPNWYIKVEPLKPAVVEAVKTKKTQFYPKKFERQFLDWMDVMHDWPISRQIAWGIRIPAWYEISNKLQVESGKLDVNQNIYVTFLTRSQSSDHSPKIAPACSAGRQGSELSHNSEVVTGKIGELLNKYSFGEIEAGLQTLSAPVGTKYTVSETKPTLRSDELRSGTAGYLQETDTFDTWFSSGQWPLVTLRGKDSEGRYPTDVMATMSDILRMWVSRMMMFGLYARGDVPFKSVYLWSTVTDAKGQKMSKSKGNVINPIELVDKYGADALRMALLFGNGEGGRVPLSEDKVRAMRNFANKIWNIGRFFLLMMEKFGGEVLWYDPTSSTTSLGAGDKEILKRLNETVGKMTNLLEKFRFSEAADTIYHFLWHEVADVYIEQVKDRVTAPKTKSSDHLPKIAQGSELEISDREVTLSVLRHVLVTGLKLLHPFMPFVTEAVWRELPKKNEEMLIVSGWPKVKLSKSLK